MTAFLDCLEINEILKQRGNIFETYETHNNQVSHRMFIIF